MLSYTTLNTPLTIHLAGENATLLDISNVTGRGILTFKADQKCVLSEPNINNVTCKVIFEGNNLFDITNMTIASSFNVAFKKVAISGTLLAEGCSGVSLNNCSFNKGDNKGVLQADTNSRIYVSNTQVVPECEESNGGTIVVEKTKKLEK